VYEQRREEQLARWKAAQAEVAELKSQSSGH
jgi:hypothetical protein